MKRFKYILGGLALGALLLIAPFAHAQVQSNYWKLLGGVLMPNIATWQFELPYLASQNCIGTDANGLFQAGTCGGGGSAYPFPLSGNATSTLTQFNGGLTSYASTTVGNGTGLGGLTVSGNSTTTLTAYFASLVGIGTNNPALNAGALDIEGSGGPLVAINGGDNATNSFLVKGLASFDTGILSNTAVTIYARASQSADIFKVGATSVLQGNFLDVIASGNIGVGTTTPANKLTVAGGNVLFTNGNGLSFYNSAFSILPLVTIDSGNQLVLGNSSGSFADLVLQPGGSAPESIIKGTTGFFGVGTSSPAAQLDVERANDSGVIMRLGNNGGLTSVFDFKRDNTTGSLSIQGNQIGFNNIILAPTSGFIGIGTTTPTNPLTLPAGTASIPSLSFGDTGMGFYRANSQTLGVATAGTLRAFFNNAGFFSNTTGGGGILWPASSATAPTLVPNKTDTTTGIGADTSGDVSIINAALETARFTAATTTFFGTGGVNITNGCYAVGGVCITGGGGGSGTVGSGTTGQFPYYAANGTALTATSSLFLAASGNIGVGTSTPPASLTVQINNTNGIGYEMTGRSSDGSTDNSAGVALVLTHNATSNRQFSIGNTQDGNGVRFISNALDGYNYLTNTRQYLLLGTPTSGVQVMGPAGGTSSYFIGSTGQLGVGSSSPYAQLSVFAGGDYASHAASTLFAIGSSTAGTATSTLFSVLSNGNVGVGTSSPGSALSIQGNIFLAGNIISTSSIASLLPYASTTALSVSGSEWLTALGTPAGTFLAADPSGRIIATTTPSGSNSAFSPAANYATTGTLPSYTYVAGVITEVGTGALSVDGANPSVGQTVLVKNESGACTSSSGGCNNGLYNVTAAGSGIAAFVLTRNSSYNSSSNVIPGIITYVISGATNDDDFWAMTAAAPITIGTTALTYTEVSGGGSSVTSVAQTVPSFLSISGSPITTSGTLAIGYSGTALPIANGGTNATSFTTSGNTVSWNGTSLITSSLTAAQTTPYASSTALSAASIYSSALTSGNCVQASTNGLLTTTSGACASAAAGSVGQFPYFSATNTLTATSTPYLGLNGNLGIGTTTPFSQLTILNTDTFTSPFSIWTPSLISTTTVYTANGSYTKPANTVYVHVIAVGGGGAGGGGLTSGFFNAGSGGGSTGFGSLVVAPGGTGGNTVTNAGVPGGGSYMVISDVPTSAISGTQLIKVGQNGTADNGSGTNQTGGAGFFAGGNSSGNTGGTFGGSTGTGTGLGIGQTILPPNGSTSGSGAKGGGIADGGSTGMNYGGGGGGGNNSSGNGGNGAPGEIIVTTYYYSSATSSPLLAAILGNYGPAIGIGTSTPNSFLTVAGNISIGADYGNAAPANGAIIEGYLGIGTSTPSAPFVLQAASSTASTTGETSIAGQVFIISAFEGLKNFIFEEIDQYGSHIYGGDAPRANNCTGFSVVGAANQTNGTIHLTSGGFCSITFAHPYPNSNVVCMIVPETANTTSFVSAVTSSGFTANFAMSQTQFGYYCSDAQ